MVTAMAMSAAGIVAGIDTTETERSFQAQKSPEGLAPVRAFLWCQKNALAVGEGNPLFTPEITRCSWGVAVFYLAVGFGYLA